MEIDVIKDQICDVCHKMWQLGWVCFQQRHLRAFGLWLGRGRLFACRARQL